MLLEFGGYTFAPGVIECVSEVRKSEAPGDLYEVLLRTRSGLEVVSHFPTRAGAQKARDDLLTQLRR
jgi:hypothetical protein